MKNSLRISLALVLFFIFTSAYAVREVKVTSVIEPTIGGNIESGKLVTYKVVITNSGDESLATTDSIFVLFGQYTNPIKVFGAWYTFSPKALAPNDTFHHSFKFTLNATSSFQIQLLFMASLTTKTNDFKGIYATFNMVSSGIEESNLVLNKVWYSNNQLHVNLNNSGNQNADYTITAVNGQQVQAGKLRLSNAGVSSETIELGVLPKGVYILGIHSEGVMTTKKFIVY